MAEIAGLGAPQPLAPVAPGGRPQPAVTADPPPAMREAVQDQRQAASAGKAPPVLALGKEPPAVDFTSLFKGFTVGKELAISAKGFFGSGFVGGHAAMTELKADRFKLDLHVRAPGNDSDKPVVMTSDGNQIVSGDGTRYNAGLSADGRTLTLTNATKPKERIELHVAAPGGTLRMTTWGFGGDGKPLTVGPKG